MKSSLSPSDYILPPKSLSERLASEILVDPPTAAEPTVSAIAERFAPEPPTAFVEEAVRPAPEPIRIEHADYPVEVSRVAAPRGMMAMLIGIALVPAVILVTLLVYGAVKLPGAKTASTADEGRAPATQQAAVASPITIPVATAPDIALTAPAKIEAKTGEEVAFDIAIDSAEALPARSLIAIRALPEGAVFSQGHPYGATEWNLKPDEIGDLRLRLPAGRSGGADLRIELVAADGAVLARAETRVEIAAGLIVRADESNRIGALIAHGEKMIEVGYFAGARAYFKRAAEAGSGEAALAVGATYDADFIATLGVQGIKAEPEQAKEWYGHAEMLGVRDVEAKLAALKAAWAPKGAGAPEQEAKVAPASMQVAADPNAADSGDVAPFPDVATADETPKPAQVGGAPGGAFTLGPALEEEWVEIVKPVNLREGPSDKTASAKIVGKGVKFKTTGRDGNWVQVSNPSTAEAGWVYARFLKPTEPPEDEDDE